MRSVFYACFALATKTMCVLPCRAILKGWTLKFLYCILHEKVYNGHLPGIWRLVKKQALLRSLLEFMEVYITVQFSINKKAADLALKTALRKILKLNFLVLCALV